MGLDQKIIISAKSVSKEYKKVLAAVQSKELSNNFALQLEEFWGVKRDPNLPPDPGTKRTKNKIKLK